MRAQRPPSVPQKDASASRSASVPAADMHAASCFFLQKHAGGSVRLSAQAEPASVGVLA